MRYAQKCPVCEGRGTVPLGFYDRAARPTSNDPSAGDKCRSCIDGLIYHGGDPPTDHTVVEARYDYEVHSA